MQELRAQKLIVTDGKGEARVEISCDTAQEGGPAIRLFDRKGVERIFVGVGDAEIRGKKVREPVARVELNDESGDRLAYIETMPESPDNYELGVQLVLQEGDGDIFDGSRRIELRVDPMAILFRVQDRHGKQLFQRERKHRSTFPV